MQEIRDACSDHVLGCQPTAADALCVDLVDVAYGTWVAAKSSFASATAMTDQVPPAASVNS